VATIKTHHGQNEDDEEYNEECCEKLATSRGPSAVRRCAKARQASDNTNRHPGYGARANVTSAVRCCSGDDEADAYRTEENHDVTSQWVVPHDA